MRAIITYDIRLFIRQQTGYVNYKAILNKKTGSAFLLVAEVSSLKVTNTDEVELFVA